MSQQVLGPKTFSKKENLVEKVMWINLRKKVFSIANVVNDPERRYWINRLKRKVEDT